MSKTKTQTTPLMEQYLSIKADYKDVLLLYRMGDFYETFYEDAKTISKILGIALTKRAHGKSADVPLAGFPYHALDNYLPKLLNNGLRVAICEQVEDPKLAKGVVKRQVVEIASPGATLNEKILDSKSNNYLASIYFEDQLCGLAIVDVSTGEFIVAEFELKNLVENLIRYSPKEILMADKDFTNVRDLLKNHLNSIYTRRDDWIFSRDYAYQMLLDHFKSHSLKGFGCEDMPLAISAAGSVIHYITENYKSRLEHFLSMTVINLSDYMLLDESTRKNLEISTSFANDQKSTLLSVLDSTVTPMGSRLLKNWLQHPLINKEKILMRQKIVSELFHNNSIADELYIYLKQIFDMERLIGKISTNRANGRDLINLKNSLAILGPLKEKIYSHKSDLKNLFKHSKNLNVLPALVKEIDSAIETDPPITIQEGNLIRKGYDKELDDLKNIAEHGKDWLLKYQEKERKRTSISTLKVSFNKVFGYYIEITNVHKNKVPDDYIRKQTLVNAERYITGELKEWEEKILGAEEKIKELEYKLFQNLRQKVSKEIKTIQNNSRIVAELDCLLSFALIAVKNKYIQPQIETDDKLIIKGGRHPVVEKNLDPGEDFIANDLHLENKSQQIWIITGPNMAGKSTFLRQAGLIVLMTQIGSFVPAAEAHISIVDRIFTRVGASDNLARGESTFLVEMNETANILNNATDKSLILLDEIGRGTSTFDGLSIAWAVSEYIHNNPKVKPKTLFATHYHELTELAVMYPRIHNYNVAVEEWNDQVVFLRKIVPGGSDNSYGIYVAQLAGLPSEVIERAKEILANLEANELTPGSRKPRLALRRSGRSVDTNQLNLFGKDKSTEKLAQELNNLDINAMTPIQALLKLEELKKIIKK